MSQAKGNKAKGRQSTRNAKHYEKQFFVTAANKARRANQKLARRNKWLANVATRAAEGKPVPRRFIIK